VREFSPRPLNPLDLIARKSHLDYGAAIEILAKQDYIDGLIIMPPYGGFRRSSSLESMKGLVECCVRISEIPAKYGKPVLAFARREVRQTATGEILSRGKIPFYESPESAARAMRALCDHAEYRRSHPTP
jgi:acyl-CoA synthetase (NDP forming)